MNPPPLEQDDEGFLKDPSKWNSAIAQHIAAQDALVLTESHWQVLKFLRDFYQTHQLIPPMRVFVKALRQALGDELGNSHALHRLFPEGPIKQGCKIAGLPKPPHCM